LTIQPQEDESYGFDLFVLPEYRKFLVGYELISRWLQYSKEAGKAKAIGVVATWNKPMQMTTKLVFGFKVIWKVRSVELFKKRALLSRAKKWIEILNPRFSIRRFLPYQRGGSDNSCRDGRNMF
jgi:hypothetical protein